MVPWVAVVGGSGAPGAIVTKAGRAAAVTNRPVTATEFNIPTSAKARRAGSHFSRWTGVRHLPLNALMLAILLTSLCVAALTPFETKATSPSPLMTATVITWPKAAPPSKAL